MGMNPFRTQGVVKPPYFTNRAAELTRLRTALRTPTAKVLLWGERRMGKSSCLEVALDAHRREGGHAILADFSTASTVADLANRLLGAAGEALSRGWKDFAAELVQRLGVTVQMRTDPGTGVLTPSLDVGLRAAPDDAQRDSLQRVLETLDQMAGARGVTLGVVLDEFQEIHRFGGEQAEWHLRGILQRQEHTSWILAGSQTQLIGRMLERNRAFYQMLERIPFGAMDAEHFGVWLEDRMLIGGVRARGMGQACIALAGPRTRDVVELARKAFDLAHPSGVLDGAMLRRAFAELVSEEDTLARPFWSSLTPHQQNVLRAVAAGARQLTGQEARARFALKSGAAVSKAVKEFVENGRLMQTADGYDFDSPYLREWVRVNTLPDLGIIPR